MVPSFAGKPKPQVQKFLLPFTAARVISIQGEIRKTNLPNRNSGAETGQSPVLDAERAAGTATTSAG
jgi:hypothetical protein